MEDYFSSYFQKLVKSPAAGSFSSDLNSNNNNNNMELLNNYSQHLGSTDHVYGVEDYSTAPDDQFSLTGNGTTHHQGLFCPFDQGKTPMMQSMPSIVQGAEIRHKNITTSMSEFSEIPTSPGFGSESGGIGNNSSIKHTGASARKRKRKNIEGQVEMKPREVVHVRAKRGQATDSHSLAERVRRERINEKLRVLQDLVPGCYKTMGMAVMLDVIINYVRSLQNQIEFLSMKLSAASLFYDFNSPEAEALETLQRTANAFEVHGMNRTAAEGCNTNERMRPRDQ